MALKVIPKHFDDLPASAEVPARTLSNREHSQSWLMLAAFETKHSLTTIEARRELDIMMPAARVFELRAMGHDIATVWTQGVTECGRKHRIVRYVFRKPRYERHWLELTTRYSRLGISMCMVLSQLWRLYPYISMLWAG